LNSNDDLQLREARVRTREDPSGLSQLFRTSKNTNLLDTKSLIPFSNWLTPTMYHNAVRFNTVFYVLPLDLPGPYMPQPHPCEKEMTTEVVWEKPSEIIRLSKNNQISIPPPQYYELRRIDWALSKLKITPMELGLLSDLNLLAPKLIAIDRENGNKRRIKSILPGDYEFYETEDMYNQLETSLPIERISNRECLHRLYFMLNEKGQYFDYRLQIQGYQNMTEPPHMFYTQSGYNFKMFDIDETNDQL